jgi:hypothetical protein
MHTPTLKEEGTSIHTPYRCAWSMDPICLGILTL